MALHFLVLTAALVLRSAAPADSVFDRTGDPVGGPGGGLGGDPVAVVAADSVVADTTTLLRAGPREVRYFALPTDTAVQRRRPKAVEYSDWYARRLTIHRWASYATLPLFAAQYITGDALLKKGRDATAARRAHGPIATAIAGLFGINTLTGGWNLIEARDDPAGRTRRNIHGILMLLADGGFVVTGTLANDAQNSEQKRLLHRRVALMSMGVSLVSYAIMLPPFRGGD